MIFELPNRPTEYFGPAYTEVSALYYRPWQFYNALVSAMEYGVLDRLLLGFRLSIHNPESTMTALRKVNEMVEGTRLAKIPEPKLEAMINRDTLDLLRIV